MRKKRLLKVFLGLVLFLSFSFGVIAQKGANTITMFALIDVTAPEGKVFKKSLEMFKKKYPGINLEAEYAYGEPFHQKIAAMAASGDLPDVIYMWPGGRSSNLMKNGLVQDLYPFLKKDPIRKRLFASAKQPQRDGKLYELPHAITSTHVFYANVALLKKHNLRVPRTYKQLKAMAPKLRAKGLEPVLMANKDSWVNQSCFFSMVVGRIAGDKWTMDAIAGKNKFTDKPFVDSLKFVARVFKDKVISPESVQVSYGEVPNLFATDKAAFLIDGEWRVNALTGLIKGKKQKDIKLLVFPKIPGEKISRTTSRVVGTGFGMNAKLKGKKADNAWKWISFFADVEAAEHRLKEQGLIPVVKVNSRKFKLSPMVKRRMKFTPKYRGTLVLDNVLDSEPITVLNTGLQKLAMGAITPEKLAAQFEKAVRK